MNVCDGFFSVCVYKYVYFLRIYPSIFLVIFHICSMLCTCRSAEILEKFPCQAHWFQLFSVWCQKR
jgi:hypothetical protein